MSNFTRRSLLKTGLGSLGCSLVPQSILAGNVPKTLAQAGASIGLDIGSAIRPRPRPEVAEIISRECNIITPENALKPSNISPAQGYWQFSSAEKTYEFARTHNLKVHGHTLFWHERPTGWLERRSDGKTLDEVSGLYAEYMQKVVEHFPETVSWDVFNEIFEQDQKFRDTFPISTFGVDFIDRCLRAVRDVAPHAKLVINEYNLECAGNWCGVKRRNALSVLRELRDRDAPIDAVGIQGHLHSRWRPSASKTLAFIKAVEDMGLEVYFSEMDVNDVDLSKDISRRDRQVSKYYGDFLGTVLQNKAVKRIVFWGITDSSNWITKGHAGEIIEGVPPRPVLFDSNFEKKPAYYAVMNALEEASTRYNLITAREAQEALTQLGFNPGPVDGDWGRRSLDALNALRKQQGLIEVRSLDLSSQQLLIDLLR